MNYSKMKKAELIEELKRLQKQVEELQEADAERKQAQERIQHLSAVLRAIRNVNQLITREKDRGKLLKGACENLVETRGYYNAWIALLDESQKLVTYAESGLGKDFLPMVERFKTGKITHCARKVLDAPVVSVIEDPPSECADCPLAGKYVGRGAMTSRLEHGGKVYGLLSVSIPASFVTDEEEQGLLREVALDIAFALHDLGLEEKRKEAEEALKDREKRYRLLIESLSEGIWVIDSKGRTAFVNPPMAKMLGYTVDEMRGRELLSFMDEPAIALCNDYLKRRRQGISEQHEFEFVRKDGSKAYLIMETAPITDGKGKYRGAISGVLDITERKQAQEALRESEERFRAVFNKAIDGILLADIEAKKFYMANEAICRMLGYTEKEIKNLGVMSIHPEEDLPHVVEQFEKQARGEIALASNIPVKRKDGTVFYADINSAPITLAGRTYLVGIFRDITERKKAEEARQKEAMRRKTLMNASLDGIAIINQEHKVVEANHRFAEMLGYTYEEVLNLHTWDWEAKLSEKEIRANFADLNKTKAVFETLHRRKDGTTYCAEVSASGTIVDDEPMVFTVSRDITGRKKAEKVQHELDAQKLIIEKMKELDRLKDDFISTVTHELRTPMTPLRSTIEMLLDGSLGKLTDRQEKFIAMMARNVERLAQFTTEVLTLSRLESGRYKLAPKMLSIQEAVEPAIELMRTKAQSRKSTVSLDIDKEITAYADAESLSIVVTNLTNNAIVHTSDGTAVTVSARNIDENSVEIAVADNGQGIPEEALENLFDRFYQAKRKAGPGYQGTGVGLAVCKGLVEAMGGKISVESHLDEGTVFRFRLPAAPSQKENEEAKE